MTLPQNGSAIYQDTYDFIHGNYQGMLGTWYDEDESTLVIS